MEKDARSKILVQVVVITLVLAFLSIGVAQKVIRVTTTTVITLPGTTKVITITKPGTTGVVTVVHGGYRVVHIEMRPNQECIIVVEGEPVSVVTIPGVSFPGTTAVYTIPGTVYETTITRVEGGTTRTTTGFEFLTMTAKTSMGPVTLTMTIPAPIYGKIMEYCKRITITMIDRFEASEPMTIAFRFPGFTLKGRVITMPTLLVTGSITATKTTTRPGTTYTTTIERAGTTMVKTVSAPGTTITKTSTLPPKTITKKIVYTTTISGKPPTETTKPAKPPKTKPKPPKPKKPKPPRPSPELTPSPTTTAAAWVSGLPTFMLMAVVIIIVVVVAAVAIFLSKRPRTPPPEKI
ncbi:MAG: hypothetical protein B6U65_00155 [Candidatus Wolframiiraptor sp. EX4484-121]|nr:MAG: hypothetical protein B6U65_00155 [Candidatus Wolframiiraptor sp. EX4484-121]